MNQLYFACTTNSKPLPTLLREVAARLVKKEGERTALTKDLESYADQIEAALRTCRQGAGARNRPTPPPDETP